MTDQIAPLALPVKPPMWQLAVFRVSRELLRARLGEPHYVETDASRTHGGDEDWWAYRTAAGHRIVLCLRVPYREALLCADPPDLDLALDAMEAAVADSEVQKLDEAYPLT